MNSDCLSDMHLHTGHSPDSDADMSAMCEVAVNAGLKYIAFTDHVEIPAFFSDGYDRMIAESYSKADKLRKFYKGRLHIARGVEMGEPMHDVKTAQGLLDSYDFDFVLGSLHNLKDDMDFFYYDYSKVDVNDLIDRFFDETLDMVSWGRFDSLAHLTYPFRYIKKAGINIDYHPWIGVIDNIFREMVGKQIALEINVSGFRHLTRQTMPEEDLIRRFRELGGEYVTIGSDAHKTPDVGRYVDEGILTAKRAGFSYITVFEDEKPSLLSID